jgi:5-methylthioribose kinase
MPGKAEFSLAYPDVYYLDATDLGGIERYLRWRGWITTEERMVGVEPAGRARMNCTLRVRTNARTIILKQSRPWIERQPGIEAPAERLLVEGHFYTLICPYAPVQRRMPQLFGLDPASLMMMLQDILPSRPLVEVYSGMGLGDTECRHLVEYLADLHAGFLTLSYKSAFENRRMRELAHADIFVTPLAPNTIDLDRITPGLAAEAAAFKNDSAYVDEVRRLGEVYLTNGPALVHGEFYPGNWLRTPEGVRVLDPENCFFGRPEFDLGTLAAHLIFSKHPGIGQALQAYRHDPDFDWSLAARFAAVEIMRRLIGPRQLPYRASLDQKKRLLTTSRALMRGDKGLDQL